MPESMDYFYAGLVLAFMLSLVPSLRRISDHFGIDSANSTSSPLIPGQLSLINPVTISDMICKMINIAFGSTLM